MPPTRVTVDALSRALCPTLDAVSLLKATSLLLAATSRVDASASRGRNGPIGQSRGRRVCQIRALHTNSTEEGQPAQQQVGLRWHSPGSSQMSGPSRQAPDLAEETASRLEAAARRAALRRVQRRPSTPPAIKAKDWTNEAISKFIKTPTPAIYEILRGLHHLPGQGAVIRRLTRHLVEERGERPNAFLYEALLAANFDTTTGSASELRDIRREMREAGIEPTQGFYHSALQLLAIHPDYLTRPEVLEEMQQRNIDLTVEGKCYVALGLLRDGQTEMALENYDQICQDGDNEVPNWVFETFVYVLGMRGFVEDAFQLFHQRLASSEEVPLRVWFYLLDEGSRSLDHEGTAFIWDMMVRPGTLTPSDGICLNVLNTAARHGDPALATAAIQLLSDRQVKLGLHHYEPLLESYVQAGDLENAFRVLCIMADAGMQPTQASTRPIFLLLLGAADRAGEVVDIFHRLRDDEKEKHELPVAAINVLLEVLLKTKGLDQALHIYRQVADLCRSGPNQQTFTLLLGACEGVEHAAFLVAEMDRFAVRPSRDVLDHLIRAFARDGSLDVALLYLDEVSRSADVAGTAAAGAAAGAGWVSRETLRTVLRRCYRERDARMWDVVQEGMRRGLLARQEVGRDWAALARVELG